MIEPNSRIGLQGSSGIEGASGVHGAKTHEERKAETSKAVNEVTPDAVITFDADEPHKFSNEGEAPVTISAGEGIDLSRTGNDYMISADLSAYFDVDDEAVVEAVAGVSSHPWKGSIDIDAGTASCVAGLILDSSLSISEVTYTASTPSVIADDYVILVYTYSTETVTVESVASGDYEAFTLVSDEITASNTPIFKILAGVDVALDLTVQQIARNNYSLGYIVVDGEVVQTLLPL
tara:strand:- start:1682 stop:2386 length:705 start_codon:yes stop_codon:yes gene_type:complete